MFSSDKNIYIQETETKPNTYATYAMVFALLGTIFCWILNEIGLFRCGDFEMRVGSVISIVSVLVPLTLFEINKNLYSASFMKYVIIASASVLTMSVTTLLTFHTTIMLLFPIFMGMLYRSRKLGTLAFICSIFCTVFSPIVGYVLNTWDIPLFEELILIGTNIQVNVSAVAEPTIELLSIGKIALYLIVPRLIMVGSCAILMFYVIRVGVDHVNNQIVLSDISRRDGLTGLFNRNYLTDVECDPSFTGSCAIFFFDVNGLKNINDHLGHEAGDMLLRECAQCLKSLCDEETSGAFRMGGDEFLVISFGTDENGAREFLSKLEVALVEASESAEMQRYGIICSMAVGYAIGDFSDCEDLIRKADTMMYTNKKGHERLAGEKVELD